MTIIVEDGTGVPNANSYVTLAEFVAYAQDRGILIPDTDPAKEILLVKAMDFLNSLRYRGFRTYLEQLHEFPRNLDADTEIGVPSSVKAAQMVAAIAALTMDLMPIRSGTTRAATRKTVGPITLEYEGSSSLPDSPRIPQLDSLLLEYLTGAGQVRVIRG